MQMRTWFRSLLLMLALGQFVLAHAQGNKKAVIPFRLSAENNIVVNGLLNGKDSVSLMLHTAADALTMTEESLKKMTTLHFGGSVDSVKSWGGASGSSSISKGNQLSLAGFQEDSLTVWTDLRSGYETDGKFGLNLFAHKFVLLNFDQGTMTVQDGQPVIPRGYQRFDLINREGLFYISATLKFDTAAFANTYLLHSGYSGGLLLDDAYTAQHPIAEQITVVTDKKLSDAYGNVLHIKNGKAPLLAIGQFSLKEVPVGFFEGAIGRQKMSVAGMEILKRFNWIISADRKFIYLRPNKTNTIS